MERAIALGVVTVAEVAVGDAPLVTSLRTVRLGRAVWVRQPTEGPD